LCSLKEAVFILEQRGRTIDIKTLRTRVHSHFVTIICSPLSRQWDRLPIGTGHSSVLLYKTTAA
jgi:hypothetical protein